MNTKSGGTDWTNGILGCVAIVPLVRYLVEPRLRDGIRDYLFLDAGFFYEVVSLIVVIQSHGVPHTGVRAEPRVKPEQAAWATAAANQLRSHRIRNPDTLRSTTCCQQPLDTTIRRHRPWRTPYIADLLVNPLVSTTSPPI